MTQNNVFFKLYASCVPVAGAERSVVCDLQRTNIVLIPNILYEILINHENKSVNDIKAFYNNEADTFIDDYFIFLEESELGFFTNEPQNFPKLDNIWKAPSYITNVIIDISSFSNHNYIKIKNELDELNCKAIEFRIFDEMCINDLINLLEFFKDSRLQHILIIIKYSIQFQELDFDLILTKYPKIVGIVFHTVLNTKNDGKSLINTNSKISYTEQNIDSEIHCGVIQTNYFSINIDTFFESNSFNSCLNKKVSIDKYGYIKNCPSMKQNFGKFENTLIADALNHPDFKKYWNVTKDSIDICKDCEFRYICTDCRAYTEQKNDEIEIDLSKPLKCGYSPYTNQWSEWSLNPLKQKIILSYGMEKLHK